MDDPSQENSQIPKTEGSAPPAPDLTDELSAVASRTASLQDNINDTVREGQRQANRNQFLDDYAIINPVPLAQKVSTTNVAPPPQKKHKAGLIIACLAILLAAAGVLVWWLLSQPSQPTPEDPDSPVHSNANLNLGDDLVQTLYSYVSQIMPDQPFLNPDESVSESFYGSNGASAHGITDSQKLAIAMQNTSQQSCTVPAEYIIDNTIPDGVTSNTNHASEACISGEALQATMRKIFGEEAHLEDQASYVLGKQAFTYIKSIDGLVNMGVSPISEEPYIQNAYLAEKDGNKIYIYEAVAMPQSASCGYLSTEEYAAAWNSGECRNRTVEGEIIDVSEPLTRDNLWHYYDKVDTFKWTFTETTEGNYVLESFTKTSDS